MAAVAAAHPAATVTGGATDEHRLGFLPVLRRVWAPRGPRPVAPVRRTYEWLYVYGFVRPATGETWWGLLPTVNTEPFGQALREFARDEGIGPSRRAVRGLDRAGWHMAKDLAIPAGVPLVFLPAASPEWQPAERLWTLVDEPGANRAFADLDELEAVLVERGRTLEGERATIAAHTHFPW